VKRVSGASGSASVRESSTGEPVDEHCRRRPAEPLRPFVAYYTGYRQRSVPPALHRGLPSPFLTLIFTLDEPMVLLAHPDPRQPPGDFGTLWSGRHLTSRFRTEIGLTPKAAARVIRFDRARHLLIAKAADSGYRLADLAATCGYFDQAHLAREFRALAGCPPSQWITEEFRNIQAGAWLFEGAFEGA